MGGEQRRAVHVHVHLSLRIETAYRRLVAARGWLGVNGLSRVVRAAWCECKLTLYLLPGMEAV